MLLQSNTKVPNRNLCVLTNELTKHKATHLADLILEAELLAHFLGNRQQAPVGFFSQICQGWQLLVCEALPLIAIVVIRWFRPVTLAAGLPVPSGVNAHTEGYFGILLTQPGHDSKIIIMTRNEINCVMWSAQPYPLCYQDRVLSHCEKQVMLVLLLSCNMLVIIVARQPQICTW